MPLPQRLVNEYIQGVCFWMDKDLYSTNSGTFRRNKRFLDHGDFVKSLLVYSSGFCLSPLVNLDSIQHGLEIKFLPTL